MRSLCVAMASGLTLWVGIAVAADAGDAAKGETVFKKCTACHSVDQPAKNGIGPSLLGVVGRKAGSVEAITVPAALATQSSWLRSKFRFASWRNCRIRPSVSPVTVSS